MFEVVQDQDHNQFILSDEFGSSHAHEYWSTEILK